MVLESSFWEKLICPLLYQLNMQRHPSCLRSSNVNRQDLLLFVIRWPPVAFLTSSLLLLCPVRPRLPERDLLYCLNLSLRVSFLTWRSSYNHFKHFTVRIILSFTHSSLLMLVSSSLFYLLGLPASLDLETLVIASIVRTVSGSCSMKIDFKISSVIWPAAKLRNRCRKTEGFRLLTRMSLGAFESLLH